MKKNVFSKALSMLLALVMVVGMIPATTIAAFADGVPETLVTSLTELYSGDETHAREDLEALSAAGLLGDDGKLVDLDIREGGESVELSALAERIADGETVGDITVNGNAATSEQIVQISQVKAAIEIAELLDEEIDVTDEHVENLESLLTGIQNGNVDLENALKTGALRLNSPTLLGEGNEEQVDYTLPENTPATLTISEDGKSYIAPYISGSTYIKNYAFELRDPNAENKANYSVGYTGANPQANTATTENNIRVDGFDWAKAIVGVDSYSAEPTVTVILPFKTDDSVQNWIASDFDAGKFVDVSKNGLGIQMDLPGYGTANVKYYFKYMYFEYISPQPSTSAYFENPGIRFPVYLVEDTSTGRYTAVATRFVAPANGGDNPRMDTLSLHVDRSGNTIGPTRIEWTTVNHITYVETDHSEYFPYLPDWSEKSTDAGGNYYWNMKECAIRKKGIDNLEYWDEYASPIPGRGLRYYIPSTLNITSDQYKIRPEGSWEQAKSGFIKLTNPENPEFPYVYPGNVNYPERQYDIELMVTKELYEAFAKSESRTNNRVFVSCLSDELGFVNDAYYPWVIESNNWETYAKCGNARVNSTSSALTLKITLEQDATVSFDYCCETDEFTGDCATFSVDYSTKFSESPEYMQWTNYSCELSAGTHTLTWNYSKDWDDRFDAIDDGFKIKNFSIRTEGEITQPEDNTTYLLAKLYEGDDFNRVALRVSDRRNFSRGADGNPIKNVQWIPSGPNYIARDTSADGLHTATLIPARITPPENVFAYVNRLGFTLTPSYGSQITKRVPFYLTVCEADPFLMVPKSSRIRKTTVGLDTDMMFSSNLAQHNKIKGGTPYQVELYKIGAINMDDLDTLPADAQRIDVPNWGSFSASAQNVLTHITVPGTALDQVGAYAIKITSEFSDGIDKTSFSTIAYLDVRSAPAKIAFEKLASEYCDKDNIPAIRYKLSSSTEETVVKYTVQGSGEESIKEYPASGGTISFTPDKFDGLKKAYIITIYARNDEEQPWSTDSMLLTVYNNDVLELLIRDVALGEIGGSTGGAEGNGTEKAVGTINIDNSAKIAGLVDADGEGAGYQISSYDFDALRSDVGLQRVISANYGSGVWGTISDRMRWTYREASGATSNAVTLNNKENGSYADLRSYSYTSYVPTSDFLIVATDNRSENAPVTITATHANSGMTKSVKATVNTLKDKLYLFRFLPKATTYVTYTNGKGQTRELHSNENGELIVYEPDGIKSDIVTMSQSEGETYVGTIQNSALVSGERNITRLEIYPCNNLSLVPISSQTLTILKPDGTPYNGKVTLRAGVYKRGEYCDQIGVRAAKDDEAQILRGDVVLAASDGVVTLYYDPTQLMADNGLSRGLQYVYEYRVDGYQPGYTIVNPLSKNPSDFIISLQKNRGSATTPQITRQEYRQYLNGTTPTSYIRNVIDYKDNIGISPNFPKAVLYTDVSLPNVTLGTDARGYSAYEGADVVKFALYTTAGKMLTGQTNLSGDSVKAAQITNLSQLDGATYFVFPFSAVPMLRSTYVMTNADMKADGIDDTAKTPTARVKAVFTRGALTVGSISMPFGITNVSNQPDLTDKNDGAKAIGTEVRNELRETTDIGAIFRSINVNDMIRKGFVFLGNLAGAGGDNFINLMILPTQDPATFRIIAFVGANQRPGDDDDEGVSVNFNAQDLAEDMNKLAKELEDSGKKEDSDSDGEGSMEFNFYGTIILEARAGVADGKWSIAFRGGNVGANVKGKYEWGQTFFCGPYPAFISFEVGFHADLEVAFGNKGAVRAMLLDAALGVSVEAFAGLGFDLSIVAIQLGIYGQIGADVNFLLLTPSNAGASTGTKLTISGEIGIKLKVKLLFISYSKKFASTGFNWTKKWNNYDQIKKYWNDQGFAQLFGTTQSGRAYAMYLYSDGSTIVEINGAAEPESRDYLELAERAWTGGAALRKGLLKTAGPITNALTDVQTNAYPYSHPAFTDDGEIFLYVSDNDNAEATESVASYAVKNGDGYENKGRVDTSEDNILADLDVVASGTKTNAFAAWVKQVEAPRMDKGAAVTNDDLGMMFNATEVYASAFNGTTWNTTRLTDNFIADMSPTVASRGNRAIVAWRSMNASSMSVDGVEDITSLFNVENSINYRIYNGTEWTDARVAYNGNAGTVNAVDSAMLSDGTALIAYTVRTGEDVTTTETFYTVIGADGNILTTGRLTSDSYTDTNAQVTAVNEDGGYFVIGWYSEHDAGEGVTSEYDAEGNATEKAVVAHDVRLARINANGSYDINFPESVGGTGESGITSDFHISAPVNNTDLENVSIVWSQRKNSDAVDDAGKYQLNAVRFFRANDVTGLTAPTDIAETAKNYTIDHFDVYTDDAGAVHAIILGSDYSSIKGIEVYDSIDLDAAAGNTVTSNSDSPKNLDILDGEAISSLKLAVGTFPQIAADVTADVNISEVIPGLTTPVQFNVKNTGTDTLTSITATVGSESKDFSLNLIPNQSATLLMTYNLPEGAVSDPAYSVASGDVTLAGGTLNLNRPDVGISGIKLLREEKGERDIQVMLTNGSMIPLAGSGKTVKLAFYKDPFHENRIGDEIAIPAEEYANIDKGIYSTVQTIDVAELYSGGGEIPEEGLTVYARAWVDETEEPDAYNNDSFLTFQGLLARNNGAKLTTDTTLEVSDNSYTVHTNIRNNSMLDTNAGIVVAVLLDSEGNIIAQKNFRDTELEIAKESETDDLSVSFTEDEIKGTPAQAEVRHICKVSFDVNGGTGEFADVITDLDGHITLPESNPVPPEMNPTVFFRGWYTAPTGGEPVTEETFFDVKTTLYAQYTTHKHVFEYTTTPGGETVVAKCVSTANDDCPLEEQGRTATLTLHAPERSADGYGSQYALITGAKDVLGTQEVSYYTATANGARGDALEEAPAAPGKYWVEFTLTDGDHSITAHVVYEIPEIEGLSFSEVTIPEYTRITDPAALNSLSADSGIEALAWIYANENSLRPDDPWNDIPKYIVFNKQYMTRPDDFPPEYWQYEDGVEYAFCYRFSYYDCNYETISVDELKNLLSNGIVEVYIPGTDSTLLTTDAEFKIVTNQEEIASALNPSTGLDATLWALANCKEHRDGIIVLSQRDEYAYTYIMFSDGSADIMNGDLNTIFDMSQWNGMPVFVADPDVSTVLNPNLRYTVTYDANGGNGNASDGGRYYVKSKIEIPAGDGLYNPNLVFDGWNTKADGTGDAYKPGDKYEVLDNTTFYAQWKHVHNWAVAYNEDTHTYTATCGVPGCPYGFLTLHPEAVSKMYDGENARPYVSSDEWTEENGLPIPAVTFYKGGEQVSDGKNVGTYTALVSLDGHEDSVGEFSVTKRPINVTANDQEKHEGETDPELTVSYESVGANLRFENDETYPWKIVTEGDRVYVQSGNGGRGDTTSTLTLNVTLAEAGTLSFDYKYGSENDWDWCRFHVDGNEKFSKSNVGDWQTFSCDLTAGSHTLAWSYSKDGGTDKNGDFFAVDNVVITTDGAVTQADPEENTSLVALNCLIADLRFANDASYPWTEVTEGDRTYAKSGNGDRDRTTSTLKLDVKLEEAGTLSFDYKYGTEDWCDWCYFYVDGSEKLKVSDTADWQTYSCELSAGSHTLTWSYTKDGSTSENGDFFAVDNIVIATEGAVTQEDPNLVLIRALNKYEGGIVEGETLNYTVSREAGDTEGTYVISVTMGENPNYDVREVRTGTLTILESLGDPQTIEASDVTATFGDTGLKINAAITAGDGTLSYEVKSGDAVTVDSEGNLTIVKAGTAVISVVASKTENYARTTKSVNVTIDPKAMTVSTQNKTVTVDGQPHGITVTVTDPSAGYTVKYGTAEGMYNLTASPTLTEEGTLTVYYQVTAENYETFTGSATLTLVNHRHEMSYTVGTGESANTITAVCSSADCPLPNSTAALTISAPKGEIVYDGAEHPAVITDADGIRGDAAIVYTKGGETLNAAPIDAGIYTASITLGDATASVEYEIKNAELTNVSASQNGTLTYTGEAQTPQITANAIAVNNQSVTFTYSRTENGEYGTMPTFTNVADSGTVYYKASAPNHNDSEVGSFTVTMIKADRTAPAAPTLDTATASTIRLTEVTGYEYSKDGEKWQGSATFTGLEKSTPYTFYQRIAADVNHNESPASASAQFSTTNHDHEWGNFTANDVTITATCANSDTFHPTEDKTATMTIAKPTLTTYGQTGDNISAEATVTNNIAGINTPTIVYKQGETVLDAAPTAAGTYTASITSNGVTASVTYTIAKAPLTITAKPKTITYGDAPAHNGVTFEGFVNGETEADLGGELVFAYSYAQYGDVGNDYTITPKGLTSDNYAITFASGTLTVVQKEVGLDWTNTSFTYDGQSHKPTATATATALVNNDVIGVTVSGEQTNAGTNYTATASELTGEKAGNYKLPTANTTTFTIGKAALTVRANPKTLTYGDAPANNGVTFEGFVNGETEADLGGELVFAYSYAQYGDVGNDYTITPGGLTSGNYEITFVPGTQIVNQKEVGLDWSNLSFTYDGQSHKPTATANGTVNNDVIGVTVTDEQTNASSTAYTATATALTGDKADNYKLPTANTTTFTIGKAALTVTANAKTITYGDAPANNGVTYSGFVNNETESALDGTVGYTYSYSQYDNVGSYTITPSGLTSGNYEITFVNGALTVVQKEVGLTWADQSFTYDAQSHKPTATATGTVNNDVISVTVTGEQTNYSATPYTATASELTGEKADNYKLPTANTTTFTIGQKNLTITAASAEKVYDAAALTKNAANDYTTNTALAEGDTITSVTITGSQTVKGESSNVPSAAVIKNGNSENVTANYNITYTNGTLKVTAKPITITANSAVKVYDATALTKNAANDYTTNTALAEGDAITSVTITGTQTNVGTSNNVPSAAVIKHNGTDVTASYAITYVNGTLEVTPKAVTITANDKTKVYDGTALTEGGFTATALSTGDSHTFTVAMTNDSRITNFGTQPNVIATVDGTAITIGTPTAVGNYLVTTVDGTLRITKAVIKGALVKLDAFEYDTTVPTAEFVNESNVEGANGTIVEGDSTKNVTYYYQATAFLKSQTDDISTLDTTPGVYKTITPTTFEPGTHYVLAVITGDNYSNVPYITQSVFEVTQNTEKVRDAELTAPVVDGTKVTVDEADKAKSLEYSLDGNTWKPVTLGEKNEFTVEWETPVTEEELKLRESADERYEKPSASVTGTAAITTKTYTVTYNANGGVNAPNAVKFEDGKSVSVSGKANMTRKGYTFTGWNTEADGTGTAYKQGDKLSANADLYAQWEANTYKVRFNANGGKGTMEDEEFTYNEAKKLPANTFEREGYIFLGWSLSANGSVQHQDKQEVKNLAENGAATLYAVWAKDLYNINGAIKSAQTGEITLQLVQGNITFGEPKTVEYTTAGEEVSFTLNGVPAGTYNLVATQGDVTMTKAVIITDDHVALELITMPTGNTSSLVDVKGNDAPAVVVGGLDDVAAAEEIDDRKVTVTIAIETQNEAEAGEAGEAIVKESRAQNAEFIDFTVTKAITNKGVEESVETMTETKSLIELIIPFNFSGKSGIKLYRFHNGKVQSLEQAKGDESKDGTYSLNQRNGFIHVFTSKFSTYAITYSNYSSSFASDYEAIVADTEHGTITVEPQKAQAGKEVVITATPDAGYKLGELTVKDASGNEVELTENEDGTYSFTQPNGKVTIEGKFIVKFVDVPENSYYAKAVDWAVLNGITNGVDETHFAPDASCTRAQAVTFLWRALGCPEPTATKSEFTDVAEGAFYFKAVLWAAENGITLGYGDGTFGVNDTVNRAQMVTFMARAMNGKATTAESFIDVPEGAYYADAAAWAKENGVSDGMGNNMFGGNLDCLRAQIVTMLYRYFVK